MIRKQIIGIKLFWQLTIQQDQPGYASFSATVASLSTIYSNPFININKREFIFSLCLKEVFNWKKDM